MNTEKLKELIDNSDSNQLQKNVMMGFIDRAKENESLRREDRKLIEEFGNVKHLSEVVLSNDEVKIYTVAAKGKDDWDTKYPYRCIFKNKNGKWEKTHTVSPSLDTAYLVYLEKKHLGLNSQFFEFAIKMLEIKIEE